MQVSARAGRWLMLARVLFLVAAVWFIARGLEGRGDELRRGLTQSSVLGVLVSFVLILLALGCTGLLWRQIMGRFGYTLPWPDAFAIFFFGQLGKYIPGSVWSFGAQAEAARRLRVPARTTISASMVFLAIHVVTALLLGAVLELSVPGDSPIPAWVAVAAIALGFVALTPILVNRLATWVSGSGHPLTLTVRTQAQLLGLMSLAWLGYALALVALRPDIGTENAMHLVASFALAYACGVVVVIAPAGIGVRETVFVVVMEPSIGLGAAASLALLTRVLMTLGDVVMALLAVIINKARRRRPAKDSVQAE